MDKRERSQVSFALKAPAFDASPPVLPKIAAGRSTFSAKKLWKEHATVGISTGINPKGNMERSTSPVNLSKNPKRHPTREVQMPKPFRILHCDDPTYGAYGDGYRRDQSKLPKLYAEMTFLANAVRNTDGTTSYKSLSKTQEQRRSQLSSARSCPGRLEGPSQDHRWSSAAQDKPHPRMLLPTSPGRASKLYAWQMESPREEETNHDDMVQDVKHTRSKSGGVAGRSFLHSVAKKRGQIVVPIEQNGRQRYTLVKPPSEPPPSEHTNTRHDGDDTSSYTYGSGSVSSSSFASTITRSKGYITSESQENITSGLQEDIPSVSDEKNATRRSQENISVKSKGSVASRSKLSRSLESLSVKGVGKTGWSGNAVPGRGGRGGRGTVQSKKSSSSKEVKVIPEDEDGGHDYAEDKQPTDDDTDGGSLDKNVSVKDAKDSSAEGVAQDGVEDEAVSPSEENPSPGDDFPENETMDGGEIGDDTVPQASSFGVNPSSGEGEVSSGEGGGAQEFTSQDKTFEELLAEDEDEDEDTLEDNQAFPDDDGGILDDTDQDNQEDVMKEDAVEGSDGNNNDVDGSTDVIVASASKEKIVKEVHFADDIIMNDDATKDDNHSISSKQGLR